MVSNLQSNCVLKFLTLITFGLLYSSVLAKQVDITTFQNPELQKFILKNPYYKQVKILGFGESLGSTENTKASSCLLQDNDCFYKTGVLLSNENITFVLDRQCAPTAPSSFIDGVITVNNQRISVLYNCVKDTSTWSGYYSFFFLQTGEGKKFVVEQFYDSEIVYVDLSTGVPIPISSNNFKEGWELVNTSAL